MNSVIKKIANKVAGKLQEEKVNFNTERAYAKEQRLERREQFNKGYREGQYKRGLAEGSGQVVPAAKQAAQRGGGKTGGGASWSPNWKEAGAMFGGSGGGGYDMFGGGEPKRAAPPMRTTRISKTGSVTIQEPFEKKQPSQMSNPVDDFWGSPGAAGGATRKKGERDPYDFIL